MLKRVLQIVAVSVLLLSQFGALSVVWGMEDESEKWTQRTGKFIKRSARSLCLGAGEMGEECNWGGCFGTTLGCFGAVVGAIKYSIWTAYGAEGNIHTECLKDHFGCRFSPLCRPVCRETGYEGVSNPEMLFFGVAAGVGCCLGTCGICLATCPNCFDYCVDTCCMGLDSALNIRQKRIGHIKEN